MSGPGPLSCRRISHSLFASCETWVIGGAFGGIPEKSTAIAACRVNNAKVRDMIAADRLLVFTPSDGWEPLCVFLGVPVPEAHLPRSNGREEFWSHFRTEPAD